MKCEICGKDNAFITVKDFSDNGKEIHLCKECARKKNIIMDEDISKIEKL